MKNYLFAFVLLLSSFCYSQTGMVITNPIAANILAGNYLPGNYTAPGLISDPNAITADLQNSISPDSLMLYTQTIAGFFNRNSNTINNVRPAFGMNGVNNWVESIFLNLSSRNYNRLVVSRMNFNASICQQSSFNEVFAVIPGSDLTDKSLILIEAHIDSRNNTSCDTTLAARGVGDNAAGSAMVIEMARVFLKYQLKGTVVFLLTIAEEQGLYGSTAFASYVQNNSINVRTVLNNDVAATTYCGICSSPPGCVPGNIADSSVRIFSYGTYFSMNKQLARFTKLEYKEQILPTTSFPMKINIYNAEDRTGRSGDHIPFRQRGYSAIRLVSQNENGDGSTTCGVQHTVNDNEMVDTNGDAIPDTYNVDYNYLKRNGIINGTAMIMAGQSVTTPTSFTVSYQATNKLSLSITDATNAPAYRIALHSLTDDWDSVYTVATKTPLITFIPNTSPTLYISVAAVNSVGAESLFTNEIAVSVPFITLPITGLSLKGVANNNCTYSLFWQTETEQNSKNFEVQQSDDGLDFTTISVIPAAGTSNFLRKYSFVVNNQFEGSNFYRLKMIDIDGRFAYSSLIKNVNFCGQTSSITTYPNPAKNTLFVSGIPSGSHLQIIDNYGKVLINQKATGFTSEQIDLSLLTPGMYILKIIFGNNTIETRKIIIE